MSRVSSWIHQRQTPTALAVVGFVLALGSFWVGGVMVRHPLDGVLIAAAVAVGVLILDRPVLLSILAMAGVFIAQRAGGSSSAAGSSGGLSYSDALLAIASAFSLPLLIGSGVISRLKLPLIGLGVYLFTLLPTVVLHYSTRGDLEWAHRLVLVGGSLLVGASIARADSVRLALRTLVIVGAIYGVLAILDGARHGFSQPAGPLGLNKNFIGAILGDVLAVLLCMSRTLALPIWVRVPVLVAVGGGLLASQSRASMLSVAVAVYVVVFLSGRLVGRARKLLALMLAGALCVGAYYSIKSQFEAAPEQYKFNSVGTRISVERATQQIWRTSPIDGVGLKYFNTGAYSYYAQAPNNVIDNELAESGIIGLAGFLGMQGLILVAAFRRRRGDAVMLAALGISIANLFHGMVDIYWTAGVSALPFILLGIAFGRSGVKDDDDLVASVGEKELRRQNEAWAVRPTRAR